MLEFLTDDLKSALRYVNFNKLCELRLRINSPVSVNYGGTYFYLCANGLKKSTEDAIKTTPDAIREIVYKACQKSVYSVNEEIKRGFVTANDGVRIGLCGTYVCDGDKVVSIRNFTSLCIRIPHNVKGCADEIKRMCFKSGGKNVLILSPPGAGKTTMLKDIADYFSSERRENVLICDERGELACFGDNADVIGYADKRTAFMYGIRAMRPDIIITDELTECDYVYVKKTMESGVCVVASAHLYKVEDVPMKIFDYYVLLDGNSIGKIKGIYGADLKEKYA